MSYGDDQNDIGWPLGGLWKNLIFLSLQSELNCYVIWTFQYYVANDRVQIGAWVSLIEMNMGHWATDWVQKL